MPAYALFGATGLCGGAILSHLLSPPHDSPSTQTSAPPDCINLYIRSTRKLTSQNPALLSMPNIHIFSGAITSLDTITSCLLTHPPSSGPTTTTNLPPGGNETPPHLVDAIFLALGANENYPGTRINQDAVHAIVAVLTTLRFAHPTLRIPKLIILSSGTLNPNVTRGPGTGPFFHAILTRALNHIYADSTHAEEFLRLHRSWLRDVTFMTPGGLSDDVAQGHRLSFEEVAPFVSYADLGAGFVEVARAEGREEQEMFRWKGVSVLPRREGASAKVEWRNPRAIVRGLVWHYAPAVAGGLAWLGVF